MWIFSINPSSSPHPYSIIDLSLFIEKGCVVMNKDEALNKFIFMMEYRNLSSNTVHMYSWYLSRMFDFYQLKDVSSLDVKMAQDYIVSLKQKYSPASLNAVISAVRYFFDVVLENPLSRRQFPNILYNPVDITIFTDEQIHMLLNTKDVRLRAFLLLGLDAGFRVGEVARLRISDIDSKNMFLFIRNSKRGKSRKVPLSNTLLKALREYWYVYRPDRDGYLFPSIRSNSKNPHINKNSINAIFRNYIKQFDFYDPHMRFHNLRDTYATLMIKNGCDIFTLKKLLGHSSFSSTSRYIKYENSDLALAPVISLLMEIE